MATVYYMIAGTDYGAYVEGTSLSINRTITRNPPTAVFSLVEPASVPVEGNLVQIYVDDTSQILFTGTIIAVTVSYPAPSTERYTLECTGYERLFDRYLVATEFASKSCYSIISDIVAIYTDPALGFTIANVQTGYTIDEIKFNYRLPSDCLRELAEICNFNWYIDDNKDIHFYGTEYHPAPYEINDTTLGTIIETFQIRNDYSQVRNRVYVQGGYMLTPIATTFERIADGTERYWNLPYEPYSLVVTVDSVVQTLGEENVDTDDGSFAYFYNKYEKIVKCATATGTPSAGAVMGFTFQYEQPVIVRANNYASQTYLAAAEGGTGRYDYILKDNTIDDFVQANLRAELELQKYGYPIITGFFTTTTYGFLAGQSVVINVTDSSYNGTYIIHSLQVESIGNNILRYSAQFEGWKMT